MSTHDVCVGIMEETSLNDPRRIPIAIIESHNNEVQLLASEINKNNIEEKVDKPERKLDYYSPDQGMDTKDGNSIVDYSEKITDFAEGYLHAKFNKVLAQNNTYQNQNMSVTGNEQIDGEVTQDNADRVRNNVNMNDERKNTYDHAFAIINCELQEVRSGYKDEFKCDDCATRKKTKSEGVQSSQNYEHEESPMSNEGTASAEVQCDTNDKQSVLDIAEVKYIRSDNDLVGSNFQSKILLEVQNSTVQQKFQSDIEIVDDQNNAMLNMTSQSRPENKDGRESMEDTEVSADEMHIKCRIIMVAIDENKCDNKRDTFIEKDICDTSFASSTGPNSSVVSANAYIAREYKQKSGTEELSEATKQMTTKPNIKNKIVSKRPNKQEKDNRLADESRDNIPILGDGDRDKILNYFGKSNDSIRISETIGEWSLGIEDNKMCFKSALKYTFPEIENITSYLGYTTLADGIEMGFCSQIRLISMMISCPEK
ncbi:hypothetical protein CHS0354_010506 [Potamilus streckersoni]|uniref:Uncharacterized protein n=1 Tax=Potamilus streckersoni TaxID=2493646 RepID=A0AAE0VPG2_9BIVA|nr:hypothetical protein CHS0354_010506 [Potamilus streckersoni]